MSHALDESTDDENSNNSDFKTDDMDKNISTNLNNLPMMKCKYNFIHVTIYVMCIVINGLCVMSYMYTCTHTE